jgi:hypothetical protein
MAEPGKKAGGAPEAQTKLSGQLVSWARSAVPAVLSGLGLSGFVSILGAAVLWSQFNTAGLPASEAVADQPTGALIVTGAASLALYLVLGLVAVLTVYLLQGVVLSDVLERSSSADPVGRLKREACLTRSRIAELEHDLAEARKASTAEREALAQLRNDAGAAAAALKDAEGPDGDPVALAHLRSEEADSGAAAAEAEAEASLDGGNARIKRIQKELREQTARSDELAGSLFKARSLSLTIRHYGNGSALLVLVALELAVVVARTTASWWEKGALWAVLLMLVLVAIRTAGRAARLDDWARSRRTLPWLLPAVASVSIAAAALVDPWTLAPVAASLLLAVACFAVGRLHPRRFFWLGISTFASVALFGAVLTYSRDVNAPSAQAAAVLLKNGCAVQGLWIGESSKRVFLARVEPEGKPPGEGRIFSLESSEVISESIGKLRRVPYANRQAAALRWELSSTQSESVLTTANCTATGQTSDYFAGSMSSFKGPATLHAETLSQPMCLVRYFDRQRAKANGGDPGANWWTTCEYDEKALGSVALVRRKLALPKAWGARNARVTATIPAGTKVTYLIGIAARQCEDSGASCYEGGGEQVLFHGRDVNRAWLGQVECDKAAESAARYRFVACEL